jgi:hypothetical protein
LGRERLHRSVSSLTLTWLYDNNALSSYDCKSQCQKKRSILISKLWNNDIQFSLKFAMLPWEILTLDEELCSSCSKAAKVAYWKARITNWDQLKTYFGICDLEDQSQASYSDSDCSDSAKSDVVADGGIEDEAEAGL